MNKLSVVSLLLVLLAAGVMAQPVITSVSPPSGNVGTAVTITGSGFGADNIVYFGAVRASVNAASATEITVTVPVGATYAPVSVLNTTTSLAGWSAQPFNVTLGAADGRTLDHTSFARTPISLPGQLYGVTFGDLDGDLKMDMVVADWYNSAIYVSRNISAPNGSPEDSFAAPVTLTVEGNPTAVAIADIDNDGKPDVLATSENANKLAIFRNISSAGSITAASFEGRVDFAAGNHPVDIAISDLEGDGKPDVVVVNAWDLNISIYRNTSAPGSIDVNALASPVNYATAAANAVAIADMDGNGRPDLMVGDYSEKIFSLLNTSSAVGGISFDAPVGTNVGASVQDIVLADLDGDGKQDVVLGGEGDFISVIPNTSTTGNITIGSRVDITIGLYARYVAAGDLDGDGRPDIVAVATDGNVISVIRNLSSPGSLTGASFGTRTDFQADMSLKALAIGDVDGDQKPDIAAAHFSAISLYRNVLDFTAPAVPSGLRVITGNEQNALMWSANTDSDIGSYNVYGDITPNPTTLLGTVNAPGNSYLHTGLTNNVTYYYRVASVDAVGNESAPSADITATPSGVLVPPPTITSVSPAFARVGSSVTISGTNFNTTASQNTVYFGAARAVITSASATQLAVTVPAGATYEPVTVTNLANGLSAGSPRSFDVQLLQGAGRDFSLQSFELGMDRGTGGGYGFDVAIGDLDNDGKPDLVRGSLGKVSIYRNISESGDLTETAFGESVDLAYGGNALARRVAITDVDGDGWQDIISVLEGQNTFFVFRNTGAGNGIHTSSFAIVSFNGGDYGRALAMADIDMDGRKDLVFGGPADRIYICRNTSSPGSVSFGSFRLTGLGTYTKGVALGDLDGDGKPDLITTNTTSNSWSFFRNISTPGSLAVSSFATRVDIATGTNTTPQALAVADMDGDGKLDVVVGNETAASVSIYRNTSTGSISAASFDRTDLTTGTISPAEIIVADLDGDGKPDLVTPNVNDAASGYLSIYRNKAVPGSIAAGDFQERQDLATLRQYYGGMAVGDLNGDDTPDMALFQSFSSFSIYRNIMDFVPPTVPSLRAIPGDTKNTVLWEPSPEEDVASYKLYGGTTPDPTTLLSTLNHPETYYSHTGLVNGTTWYYRIIAVDAMGNESDLSAEVSATPAASTIPVITQVDPGSGNPGTSVTITGTNFGATAADNVVHFGATRASVASASATQLSVTVPAGATYAPVSVLNTATQLAGGSAMPFAPTYGVGQDVDFNTDAFAPKVDLTAGDAPVSIAAADIDGDGKSDVVAVNRTGRTFSVYRNIAAQGDLTTASFASPVDLATGVNPSAATLADLDNDGRPDLIVTNEGDNTVSIYRNTATPGSLGADSFAPAVDLATGIAPIAISVADVDGDGKRDLAVVNRSGQSVSVFRNMVSVGSITTGSFAAKVDFSTDGTPRDIVFADIDGDGAPDLVTTDRNNGWFQVYRNTAAPGDITNDAFASPVRFNSNSAQAIVTADLDRDGKHDVIVTDRSGYMFRVFRNAASPGNIREGSFDDGIEFPLNGIPSDLAIGDVDGDGRQDIIVGGGGGDDDYYIRAYRNIGDPGTLDINTFTYPLEPAPGNAPTAMILNDMDGDGQPDLLWASQDSDVVSIFRNTVDFTAPATPQNVTATGDDQRIIFHLTQEVEPDVAYYYVYGGTSPGDEDIMAGVGAEAGDHFYILYDAFDHPLANGTTYYVKLALRDTYGNMSAFSEEIEVLVGPQPGPVITDVTPGAAKAGATVTITGEHFNTAPSGNLVHFGVTKAEVTQASATQLNVTVPLGATYRTVSVLDVDGGRSGGSRIPFAAMAGTGMGQDLTENSFDARVEIANASQIRGMALADIDGDGKPDLVATNYNDATVSVYRNVSSSGTITANSFAEPVTFASGAYPRFVVMADLDNDGKKDMVVSHEGENTLYIYRNTATAGSIDTDSFDAPETVETNELVRDLSVADIDLDGKQDIALATDNSIYIHRNRTFPGNIYYTHFANPVRVGANISFFGVAVGDLDGDGKPEIVGADYYANTFIVYRNIASRGNISSSDFAAGVAFASGGDNSENISIADMDRDGKSDLVIGATYSTIVSIYHNTATTGIIDEDSFAPGVEINPTQFATIVAVDDLDGDGRPDIVSFSKDHEEISIFRNVSAPGSITTDSFRPVVDLSMGGIEDAYTIVLGDLDGDGKSDITVPNGTDDEIQIFHNAMDLAAPAVPMNLTAVAGANDIVLTWDANTDPNMASYKVYGGTTPEPTALLGTVDAPATTYTHEGVTHGTMYYYRIAAVKTFGYEGEKTADARAAIRVSATITFPTLEEVVYGVADFTPGATSTNTTTPVQYASSNTAVATIVDGKIHVTGAGTTVITASQPQDDLHLAAANVTRELVVSKANAVITFPELAAVVYGEEDFSPGATSTNTTAPVQYASSNTAVATIVEGKIHLVGGGTAVITASQPEDDLHFAATELTRELVVSKATQSITFSTLADKTNGDVDFSLAASATSELPVSFGTTTAGLISIAGNTVTILKPGRASITATQPGDDRYTAATPITHSFCVVPARPAVTVNLDNPETPVLTSNAASGNQWYLNDTAIEGATQSSHTVVAQGIYTVKVTADDCVSEMSATVPIVVTGAQPAEAAAMLQVYPNPAAEKISIRLPGKGMKRIMITSQEGRVVFSSETASAEVTVDVQDYAGGVYAVSATLQHGIEVIRFVKK